MITNGIVSVEDGKKQIEGDQFSPTRKIRVELTFTIYEGADEKAVLHDASMLADAQVRKLLGMKAAPEAAAPLGKTETTPAADKPKTSRAGKKAEALPAVESFPLDGEASAVEPKADESILDDSILGAAEPAPKVDVSDKALYDLVVSINAKVKKPKEITEIITRFCPQDGVPPSLKRVPEVKRVEFIEAVKAFSAAQK